MLRARAAIALAVVALPAVMLWPAWRLGGLGAGEDDILYYYPMRVWFRAAILAGDPPWWNPWTGLGRPFMADPQTAVWYPPTWLFALAPPDVAYPASLWLHYSIAILGAYRLLRSMHVGRGAALFGAAAFAFSGFMLAHRAHFTMQHAAAWAPWVLWRFERLAAAGADHRRSAVAWAAMVAAAQCLAGHVQIAALTALAALVLTACVNTASVVVWRRFARWAAAWTLAAGLFAIQAAPTAAYLRHCTRTEQTYGDFVENSWSPASLVALIFPMLFGQRTPNFFEQRYWGPSHQVEQCAYPGLAVLLLASVAARTGASGSLHAPRWRLLAIAAALLALGQCGPVCPILYWLPGASVFRVPARAMLFVNLAAAVLAALALHGLCNPYSVRGARLRSNALALSRRSLVIGAACLALPLLAVGLAAPWLPTAQRSAALAALSPSNPAVWLPVIAASATLAAAAWALRAPGEPRGWAPLALVTLLDLGLIGWSIDVPRGEDHASLTTPSDAAWMCDVADSAARLWVVTNRVEGAPGEYVDPLDKCVANTNILHGVTTLTDYGPLQPRAFAARLGARPWGESLRADALLIDPTWRRNLNVGWILVCDAARPAPADASLHTATAQGWRLYRTPTRGPLYAVSDDTLVRIEQFATSAVGVRARVVADPRDPGAQHQSAVVRIPVLDLDAWRARINGRPALLGSDADGLRLTIPLRTPIEIELSYYPAGLRTGAAISAVAALALLALLATRSRRTRGRTTTPDLACPSATRV